MKTRVHHYTIPQITCLNHHQPSSDGSWNKERSAREQGLEDVILSQSCLMLRSSRTCFTWFLASGPSETNIFNNSSAELTEAGSPFLCAVIALWIASTPLDFIT